MAQSNFKVLSEYDADYCPGHFKLYESNRTGMRVATVSREGPKIYGYFVLATEIHDDSGAPHTLEHLIFTGSKNYQYNGVLDKLSMRAYSWTNAWTATDHTAYQLESAGWEGFAQILPVYLEHVLLPTLSDSACLTEVHHVDGSGNDAGVVYSEMQGTENESISLMDLAARRLLYPEKSGFRYETGGLTSNLRVLTADKIREFHKLMYQPRNLCVVLIGEIDERNMLQILEKFEDGVLSDVPKLEDPFERPWGKSGKTPTLKESTIEVVEFPESDESMGEVLIGFLGPDFNDEIDCAALTVILVYIAGSSASVLINALVEKEQLASSVTWNVDYRPDVTIWFQITGVQTEKLEAAEKRFFKILQETSVDSLDMTYLIDCLERTVTQVKFDCEQAGDSFQETIIKDYLFGKRDGSTFKDIGTMKQFDVVQKWTEQQWRDFLSKWIAHAHHVSILGKPSSILAKNIEDDENARLTEQKSKLGEKGMKESGDKLEAAKRANSQKIPSEMFSQFPVPPVESIHFIRTVTARAGYARQLGKLENSIQTSIDQDDNNIPLFLHFEHIKSNFVSVNLVIGTHTIPTELRPLLPAYLENFFNSPLKRNGKRLEFEEVVMSLEKDTVGYSIDLATSLDKVEMLRLRLTIEPSEYQKAVEWVQDLLFENIFDVERLKATIAKILADVPEEKRDGEDMSRSVLQLFHLSRESSARARNTLVKARYLPRILRMLDDEPELAISKFEDLHKSIAKPSNFRVYIAADLESGKLEHPVSTWKIIADRESNNQSSLRAPDALLDCMYQAGKNPGKLSYIVPMPPVDSSFAVFVSRGPSSYMHPAFPAITVAILYLDIAEGPLWVATRGAGLAYGGHFRRSVESGRIFYDIYRSPDAFRAYEVIKKTIEDIAYGRVPLDPLTLEGAVSFAVLSFADDQPTMISAADASFSAQVLHGLPKDWAKEFMKLVRAVTKEDVLQAMKDYVLPVFEPGKCDMVVTCATIMESKQVEGFKAAGFPVHSRALSSFFDTYELEGADEVLSDSDEDDDDEDEEGESGDDTEEGSSVEDSTGED